MTGVEEKSLAAHVLLCQERYMGILGRLKRLEYILMALVGVLVLNGEGPLTAGLLKIFVQ